jgi:hypothetical protein
MSACCALQYLQWPPTKRHKKLLGWLGNLRLILSPLRLRKLNLLLRLWAVHDVHLPLRGLQYNNLRLQPNPP